MKIPLRAGRDFSVEDREGAPLVGIINETCVREFFRNQSPIGARFHWARDEGPPKWFTIIGIVSDVRHFGLEQPDQPAVYTSYAQSLQPWKRWMCLVVRAHGDVGALVGTMKSEIWKVDNHVPVTHARTMSEVIAVSTAQRRFNMLLMAILATVALALTAVGVYGVISYAVTERTREIGIRTALGARRSDVVKLVVGQVGVLILAGFGLGLMASFALSRLMAGLLFEVTPEDPATFSSVMLLLAGAALFASYLPARRATKVDPMVALRYE